MRRTSLSGLLDELSPDLPAAGPGWGDVLARAELFGASRLHRARPSRARRLLERRVVLAVTLVVTAVIPLLALAAANDWWFFRFRETPRPFGKPLVVTRGSWDGYSWSLVAYDSKTQGTCWSITFDESPPGGAGGASGPAPGGAVSGADNALGCGGIVGLRPPHPRQIDLPTVMYMTASSFNTDYPSWIAGPVVDSASTIVVRYRTGAVLRTPTTRPVELSNVGWFGRLRFFASPLPAGITPSDLPDSITGFDSNGKVVACLVPRTASHWYSLLSECER